MKSKIAIGCFFAMFLCVNFLYAQEKYGNQETEQFITNNSTRTSENDLKYVQLSNKWKEDNTKLSIDETTFLRIYFTTMPEYNPLKMDTLTVEIYALNENEKFEEAIALCEKLKSLCPYNLAVYKEQAYALGKLDRDYSEVWNIAKKIGSSMLYYEEGRINEYFAGEHNDPFFALSFMEGVICYDMAFGGFPKQTAIAKYEGNQLLGVYSNRHTRTKWAYLNHAQKFYPLYIDMIDTD